MVVGGGGLINKFCGCGVRDLVRFNMGKCKKIIYVEGTRNG